MTPEEKAVIDAAEVLYHEGQNDHWTACSLVVMVGKLLASRQAPLAWTPTAMRCVLAGDRIRLGGQETTVLTSSAGTGHAAIKTRTNPETGKQYDTITGWEHMEVRLRLEAVPELTEYPPNLEIEILCTPERAAVLTMMTEFPGSAITSSDVH